MFWERGNVRECSGSSVWLGSSRKVLGKGGR